MINEKFSLGITNLCHQLQTLKNNEGVDSTKVALIIDCLSYISKGGTHYTDADFADTELGGIIKKAEIGQNDIELLLISVSRVVRKVMLKTGNGSQPEQAVIDYFLWASRTLSQRETKNVDYLFNAVPQIVIDEKFNEFREQVNKIDQKQSKWSQGTETRIREWANNIGQLEERLSRQADNLKNYQQQYNFVSLAHAFEKMLTTKRTEMKRLLAILCTFGFLLLTPFAVRIFLNQDSELLSPAGLAGLLPYLGIELLLLYYFRIFLQNYYSTKAQALQLELRFSLCSFIESYVDFVKEKDEGKDGRRNLEKFEALIFSGLSPDMKSIPSTFDGVDQFFKLIKDVKKA